VVACFVLIGGGLPVPGESFLAMIFIPIVPLALICGVTSKDRLQQRTVSQHHVVAVVFWYWYLLTLCNLGCFVIQGFATFGEDTS
jgi:hypothetical protein